MKHIFNLYFSPTGNAEKIGTAVAEALAHTLNWPLKPVNLTLPEARETLPPFEADDLVVITMPVYAGRLPNKMAPELARLLKGNQTPAVALVTYGNRHFDDALSELVLRLRDNGFIPIGAATMPSEHAFSQRIASNRPDETDLAALKAFGTRLGEKLLTKTDFVHSVKDKLTVPGNMPPGPYYTPLGTDGQPAQFLKAKPKTHENRCTACGLCARLCPMGSIDQQMVTEVHGICIKCQACIRHCPNEAKYFDDPAFLSHVAMLECSATKHQDPAFFVAGE